MTSPTLVVADAVKPKSAVFYYHMIMKPRVVFLLVLSSLAGYFAASVLTSTINWLDVFILIVAGYLSSGGANAVNSWFDRDIDKIMYRTKKRPIPEGYISPTKALAWAIISIALGVGMAYYFLNPLTSIMMLTGAIWYAVFYTMILKRTTRWNIIWGGIAGTFPVYAGWVASLNALNFVLPWLIGLTVWIWIPLHFWSLAIRFRKEYAEVNVPMLPVVIGVERTVPFISKSGLLMTLAALSIVFASSTGIVYLIGLIPLTYWIMKKTWMTIKNPTEKNSWTLFKVSNVYLIMVDFLLILDSVLSIYFSLPTFGFFN